MYLFPCRASDLIYYNYSLPRYIFAYILYIKYPARKWQTTNSPVFFCFVFCLFYYKVWLTVTFMMHWISRYMCTTKKIKTNNGRILIIETLVSMRKQWRYSVISMILLFFYFIKFIILSVSVCRNQAHGKIQNKYMSKPHRSYNVLSLNDLSPSEKIIIWSLNHWLCS